MAPLSRLLSGVILPHDSYGSHLDASGKTKDNELEVKNFRKAGETLAEIWSNCKIDSYQVEAEYIDPAESQLNTVQTKSEKWLAKHVRQSQYLMQIVKCDDQYCCKPWRTNWSQVISSRFLPAPFPFVYSAKGVKIPEPEDASQVSVFASIAQRLMFSGVKPKAAREDVFQGEVPYDLFCPSQARNIHQHVCSTCGIYFPSKAAVKRHKPAHVEDKEESPVEQEMVTDDEDVAKEPHATNAHTQEENQMPVFRNIFEVMRCPWVDEESSGN